MEFSSVVRAYPGTRLRRTRQNPALRGLVAETHLCSQHLIQPLFVTDRAQSEPIPAMPGLCRFNLTDTLKACERALAAGIATVALFPVIDPEHKSLLGEAAWDPQGLIPRSLHAIKQRFPELLLMADVALDPYTIHGQDGICNEKGHIDNDATIEALVQQALCLAKAGADIIGPSDMMDGRIAAIRHALERQGLKETIIISYAAKYASAFYGPFREAVGSQQALGQADKKTYQMDPANSDEALAEVAQDLAEGADMILIKPGMLYQDIIYRIKQTFRVPTVAYQVSGEYGMIQLGIANGWLDPVAGVIEPLVCLRRAGADAIITYFATDIAPQL